MLAALVFVSTFGKVEYKTRNVEGWKVHVRVELLRGQSEATESALELLRAQLVRIKKAVPKKATTELTKVPLWFSPEYPGIGPRCEYHPGAQWLKENGRDPGMAKGVEFSNVRIFESECRRMPVFALHELAHSYHDRVLKDGFENTEIKAAFEHAKASGMYDRVQRKDADGKVAYERAYAMTNPMEYFAESTEAYFDQNDFFPFDRAELEENDRNMYLLLKRVWGDSP